MFKEWSKKKLSRRKSAFLKIRNEDDLATLIDVSKHHLQLMASQPKYRVFSIPKSNGGERWIEDPSTLLKQVQRSLNSFLQAVYYYAKTPAAYGFMVNKKYESAPRNIITNAEKHLGNDYLLNVDMKDFFHYISMDEVHTVFRGAPFHFSDTLSELLAKLCTHNGRLPMGAPTSPVLSNFATISLDGELLQFAAREQFVFTRFADDMSFSGSNPIGTQKLEDIVDILRSHRFELNEQKVRFFGAKDIKEVTGLVLKETVVIPDDFLEKVQKELAKLEVVMKVQVGFSDKPSKWVQKFQQRIGGQIAFVGYVMGSRHPAHLSLRNQYENAIDPPDEYGVYDWMDFPYF